jgi:hypothetical protein
LSTILDALRKAQEETGDKRQAPVGEHPAATEAVVTSARARRRVGWPVAVVGILAVAFAGGLAFGDRIAALLGNGAEAPPPDTQVASKSNEVAVAPAADVKQKSAEQPAAAPASRRGKRSAEGKAAASNEPVARVQGQGAAPDSGVKGQGAAPDAAPAAAPTPYGQLHVFGAQERPAGNKPTNEDRLARLQQLREKMQKARQDATAHDPQEAAPTAPTQIFVPPPRDASPGQAAAAAKADAVKTDAAHASASREPARGSAGGAPAEDHVPPESAAAAAASHDATVEVARAERSPPADAPADRAAAADPAEPAVGVSVTNAHAEATEPEVQDPEAAAPHEAPAAAPEPPTTVAALSPPQPAPAAAARPAAASPVLRRAPGGAPQVAINILQWSAEPGRRFAFVSVDGGNMTQVREGDHIGGLTIKHIHQQMIEFGFNDSTFLLRAN